MIPTTESFCEIGQPQRHDGNKHLGDVDTVVQLCIFVESCLAEEHSSHWSRTAKPFVSYSLKVDFANFLPTGTITMTATKYTRTVKAEIALSDTSVLIRVRTRVVLQKTELFGHGATQKRVSCYIHLHQVIGHSYKLLGNWTP